MEFVVKTDFTEKNQTVCKNSVAPSLIQVYHLQQIGQIHL